MIKAAFIWLGIAALTSIVFWPLGAAFAVIAAILLVCGLIALPFHAAKAAERKGRGK